ncbi:MAG: phospholipase D-like domain-containing protein [Candidatus Micrarchaeia archaeon]|jgi:phosphatidylserine/phosphatidylglycerophosphate/cardiolipin synthase-like enzyme
MNTERYRKYFVGGFVLGILVVVLLIFLFNFYQTNSHTALSVTPVFSPEDGKGVISFINSAKDSLDMEMYLLSSDDAINALLAAKDRGVYVRVILERDLEGTPNYKAYDKLSAAGISVKWASGKYTLTHAKFIIVDGKLVLVGSHNLSNNALEKNREASVILSGEPVKEFEKVFETDWALK